MSKMFRTITMVWNPVVGCDASHGCTYCWARELAATRLKHLPRYKDGFKPALIESEFSKKFKLGDFVFVSSMGDAFGEWVPQTWIDQVLAHIKKFPDARFLLQTKNPSRYVELDIPQNAYVGTTIESNRGYPLVSKSPATYDRYSAMAIKFHPHKFISIEPIMDFDIEIMVWWMREIAPEIIEIGYDNYFHRLVEPPLAKTEELIRELRRFTTVKVKTMRRAWDEEGQGEDDTEGVG